jgi:Cdc6-like AAA superfamily ATPase
MDFMSHVRLQKNQISRQARLIRNPKVFDFDYVPDEPLLRVEATELIRECLRFDVTGIPTHYAVIGSRGSGKTLTMKLLQRTLPKESNLRICYANCRQHNTSFKILAHLLGVKARGTSLSELFDSFCLQTHQNTIVILDEVDLMSPKDRDREILYLLSRSSCPFQIVMLSNSPRLLRELDPATRSSLQCVPLHFANYNAEQIAHILEERARRGLQAWDGGQLRQIAALTVKNTNADARVAIKTLYHLTCAADEGLESCFNRARRDVVHDLINDLSDGTLMILWAVTTAKSDFAKEVYRRYSQLCQARLETPFSYMHFCSNLSYLQSIGLIALVSTKVGRTYTHRVLRTFEEPVVEELCRLRFST